MTALAEAEAKTDTKPSLPQIICGNYRKGKYAIHGMRVSIENPRGSTRSAKDGSWRVKMPAAYGYILGTQGADSQHIDCFLGPHHRSPLVYVIDQQDAKTGKWDEHKCFIGFASPKQVKRAYEAAFSDGKGKDRLGALHEMTVAQFKQWLDEGNTKKPFARASGGRVGMADGGTPYTGPNLGPLGSEPPPFEATAPVDGGGSGGAPAWNQTSPAGPDAGVMSAIGHGAASGATFGFSDELQGLRAAAPKVAGYDIPDTLGPLPVPARMFAGAARLAKQYMTGESEAGTDYAKGRDEERQVQQQAKAQHPIAYGAGEVAGSIPAMAALPEASAIRGAGLAADIGRGVVTGAEYGGLSGFGEGTDAGSRVENAGAGVLGGATAGAIAPVIGKGAEWAYDRFGKPIVQTAMGWANPEAEAARRVATALQADSQMISAGTAKGMTPQQWIAARNAGEPVTLADLGAGNTQSLLRSAANTSPEGRAMLEQVIQDRFLNQQGRVADTVRGLIPGGANANQTAENLVKAYDAGRKPLYKQAYVEGDREIMTPEMERLMGSPAFVDAMKRASVSGKDRAITEGYGAFNPAATVENGIVSFKPKPNGTPTYPNLQFWDATKRELDDMASSAGRSGEKGRAQVIGDMSRTLRGELDNEVPSYGDARGFASQFFGENNALEAGRTLAGKKVDPAVIQQAMAKMKPDERKLFQEGYASDWADRVIGNISQTRDITKAMFNSPNERARAEAVFGPTGMAKIQARMTLETIMDAARQAMGNSTTARQLIEAGLAGGALGGYEGYQHYGPLGAVLGFAGGAGSAPAFLKSEMAAGARHLIGRVDVKTARNVAELLTSDDPARLRQGLGLAMRNQRIMDGLKRVANAVSLGGLAPSGRDVAIKATPMIQGSVGASADQKQNQP